MRYMHRILKKPASLPDFFYTYLLELYTFVTPFASFLRNMLLFAGEAILSLV